MIFINSLKDLELLLRVFLVVVGDLENGILLIVEIIVVNDVSIGEIIDSDFNYGLLDGRNFIGFELVDIWNYFDWVFCFGIQVIFGEIKIFYENFEERIGFVLVISFYFDQFIFILVLKLDKVWGFCFIVYGGGYIKIVNYVI